MNRRGWQKDMAATSSRCWRPVPFGPRILLGTSITSVFVRTAPTIAMAAAIYSKRRRGSTPAVGQDAISIMTSTVSSWRRRRPQVSIFGELRTRWGEKLAAVRRQEIKLGSDGDDAGRVDRRVASIIVPLDMREIYGRGDSCVLVEYPGVIPEIGIVDDPPKIAFEMPDIDGIEPHERREH